LSAFVADNKKPGTPLLASGFSVIGTIFKVKKKTLGVRLAGLRRAFNQAKDD